MTTVVIDPQTEPEIGLTPLHYHHPNRETNSFDVDLELILDGLALPATDH